MGRALSNGATLTEEHAMKAKATVMTLVASLAFALPVHALSGVGLPPAGWSGALAYRFDRGPGVRIWISGDNTFRRGDRARVYFRTEEDAFVTVVRIDTDGRMHVLFPEDPQDDYLVREGQTYSVYNHGREFFT